MSALSRSMRASMTASKAACAGVKNSAPSSASSNRLILRRAAGRASCARPLGARSPALRWPLVSRPGTPGRAVGTDDTLIAAPSARLLRLRVPRGPPPGQAPPVTGVQPDPPELLGGHKARRDGTALKARRQPPRISRIPLRPARQVPHLLGVGQHALEPLGLQPVQR